MDDTSPFDLAGNPTRMAILQALVAASREGTTPSFAELRRRAGVDDSGNFNYHLNKLRGRFVEQVDSGERTDRSRGPADGQSGGGYRLTYQGRAIVAPLLAGTYDSYELDSEPVDADCQFCGQSLSVDYTDGVVRVRCPEGHTFSHELPPGTAAERSVDDLLELTALAVRTDTRYVRLGVCRLCQGRVDLTLMDSAAEEVGRVFAGSCDRCGQEYHGPPAMFALTVPEVADFLRRHGDDPETRPFWEVPFPDATTRIERDPVRVRTTFERAGESVTVTFDATGSLLSAE